MNKTIKLHEKMMNNHLKMERKIRLVSLSQKKQHSEPNKTTLHTFIFTLQF